MPIKDPRKRDETLSDEQVHDLELAGGVEGGMPAGDAGGPGETDAQRDASAHGKPSRSDEPNGNG